VNKVRVPEGARGSLNLIYWSTKVEGSNSLLDLRGFDRGAQKSRSSRGNFEKLFLKKIYGCQRKLSQIFRSKQN
jgi:hypothetical protein